VSNFIEKWDKREDSKASHGGQRGGKGTSFTCARRWMVGFELAPSCLVVLATCREKL
jgi:hypothetical protein